MSAALPPIADIDRVSCRCRGTSLREHALSEVICQGWLPEPVTSFGDGCVVRHVDVGMTLVWELRLIARMRPSAALQECDVYLIESSIVASSVGRDAEAKPSGQGQCAKGANLDEKLLSHRPFKIVKPVRWHEKGSVAANHVRHVPVLKRRGFVSFKDWQAVDGGAA